MIPMDAPMKLRWLPWAVVLSIAAFVVCLWSAPPCMAGEPGRAIPHPAPAASSSYAIPVSEIVARAAEVTPFLQELNSQLAIPQAIQSILTTLPNVRLDIDGNHEETMGLLATEATLDQLQARQRYWQERRLLVTGWLRSLTVRAGQVKAWLDQLVERQKIWTETRDAARASNAPSQVLQQVDAVLESLGAVRIPLEVQLKDTLDLQAAVAREVTRCDSMLSQLGQAQHEAVGGLLTRDSPPIWSPGLWKRADRSLPGEVSRVVASSWAETARYVSRAPWSLAVPGVVYFALAWIFRTAGRRMRRAEAATDRTFQGPDVFDYPWSAAYIVSTLYMTGPIYSAPEALKSLLRVASFIPMVRMASAMGPRAVQGGIVVGALFALESIRHAFSGTPLLEQGLVIAETLAGALVLGWMKARGRLEPGSEPVEHAAFVRLFRMGGWLITACLASGFVFGVLGYMRLARLLASTAVDLGFLVLLFYSCTRILMGMAALGLESRLLGGLRMVQNHRGLLLRRAYRALAWLAAIVGLMRLLDNLGLFQSALELGSLVLSTRFERGAFSLSVGDVLAFPLTVWVAKLLSRFIRFALQEDVYPRLGIPVGLSYAASSLLHYTILSLGVLTGLALLGLDLTKVTVLAGALGVGIGFGLQSVVNNFVSGLILLFERPIHVGDSIEVGEKLGEVRRIGIRASTIRTRQGAEIIVPNAQLVTDQVTNWTLSDQLRRIDLPVGVNYGAPPWEVIAMLEGIARRHPRIMTSPPPQGLLLGFGDSSMSFELRAWTDEFADWARVRSDLAVAAHDGIAEAGWSIPFPQREVRILEGPK
jgi:small-conductance mechanosensitive channel